MLVRLGSFTFHSDDYPGDTGFTISAWQGWTDGPGQRRDSAARVGGHGSHDAPSFSVDRSFTFRGRYNGSSVADVEQMGEALAGLEGHGLPVTVQRANVRWADARVDRVRFDEAGYAAWADYQVELWLPDPRKFGDLHTWTVANGGSSTMHHYGNAAAAPRFVVSGPHPSGYSITATGRPSFQVDAPLPSGSTDVVDFATGRVRRNGVALVGAVPFPRVWSVPGGGSQAWAFAGTGAGGCVAELTDTFI